MAHFAAFAVITALALLALAGCATVAPKHPPLVCFPVAPSVIYCEPYEGEQSQEPEPVPAQPNRPRA